MKKRKTLKQKLKNEVKRAQAWNDKLSDMVATERFGRAQVDKIREAYIAVLLNKLGATEDKPIILKAEEIDEAVTRYEVRAIIKGEPEFCLYCADLQKVEQDLTNK